MSNILSLDLSQYDHKYVVYMLTFPNGKKYCGYSSNIKRRWRSKKEYNQQKLVYRAIQKYGWDNIKKEIIYCFNNSEDALLKEKEIIEKLNLLNPNNGYNAVPGGGTPPHGKQYLSPEGLKKLQENGKKLANLVWNDPEKRAYVIQRMKEADKAAAAKMTSEERKIRYGHNIGKTPPNAKPIYQLDITTNKILNKYSSACEAARVLNLKQECSANIRAVANGKKHSAYGYKWRWVEK